MEVSGVFDALAALPPEKNPRYPPGEAGWTPEQTWTVCLCRESRPDRPARSLVTTLTELSQLLLV